MVYEALLADMGQPDSALAQVRAMLKGTPDDRDVYTRLAQMYSRLKRWPESEDALNHASDLSTKEADNQYIAFLRGSIYERQKKYSQAEDVFRKVLAANPQNASVLNYLGYMLADRGVNLDEALMMIKRAIELEPANRAYLDSLGWAFFKLGKFELAEENLNKASQGIGTDPIQQEHLGDLYEKTGRLELAASHWEQAIQAWMKTVPAEVDSDEMATVAKKLDAAKVRLGRKVGAAISPSD